MSSSFAITLRSVLGAFPFNFNFNFQSLSLHARGSLPAHQRARRQSLSLQYRNDPSRSHCARRTRSFRLVLGRREPVAGLHPPYLIAFVHGSVSCSIVHAAPLLIPPLAVGR